MNENLDYRPANIEFNVDTDNSNMPDNLGEFASVEDFAKDIGSKIVVVNQSLTVNRHMDAKEKKDIRENYNDVLENILPRLEKNLSEDTQRANDAKKTAKDSEERVNAAISEVRILSKKAKEGLIEVNLDDTATIRVPYEGKYYFYTYIDGMAKLCKIRIIPEDEKGEIFNAMAGNEDFFNNISPDGEIKPQEGPQK